MSSNPESTSPSPNQAQRDANARIQLARACGHSLLHISAGLEQGTLVTRDAGAVTLALVGFAARGRRLLKAAYTLLDTDQAPEAVPLLRIMSEYVIVGRWLMLDPETNHRTWALDDLRRSLLVDDRAFEHGGFRLMDEETRKFYEEAKAGLQGTEEVEGESSAASKSERLPGIEQIAALVELSFAYNTAYRLDSQSAVHATTMAMNNMYEENDEGYVLRPMPHLMMAGIDSYALGAAILLDLLHDAAIRIPELGWIPHLELAADPSLH